VLDHPVALARCLFQTSPVEDRDPAARVSNETGLLKRTRNKRDRRPTYAKHLGEKLLRERN